jgi:uncharacterized membrane protein YqiK
MTSTFASSPAGWLIAALIAVIVVCFLFYWFYRRSTKETAFVRTGLFGQKVVINGGAFVVPIFHDVTLVNMRTNRIEVQRARDSAIITKDRMRVDVVADFFVRVEPEKKAVATAAQAIGRRLMDADGLREMVEGKFVDTLRAVAAEMTMEELHEKRGEYARRVRDGVTPTLASSGLQLEAVSLTQLDQTNMEYFNPSNAFDAEGLTRLTEEIERRKKKRNDIEQDTLIAIRNKNLETEKLALEIDRETEVARIAQEREVEIERAAQRAQLATERSARELQAQQAEISLQEGVERSRIAQQLAIDTQRIHRETELQRLEVERRKALEIAEQMRAIAVADQSRRQSEAQAAAERARAVAIAAEEEVFTARELAVAERSKQVQLIAAAQEAERDSTRLLIAASADKQAASERAEAVKLLAHGDAEAERIRALAQKIRHEGSRGPAAHERGAERAVARGAGLDAAPVADRASGGHRARERQAAGEDRRDQDPSGRWPAGRHRRRGRRRQWRLPAEPQRPDRQQRAALSRARSPDRQTAQGDRPAGRLAAAGNGRRHRKAD